MPACGLRGRVYSRIQGGAPLCGAVPMERKRKEEVDMTNILLEKKGYIAVATINRPKALNALNSEVLSDLDELVATVKADDEIRALVITGSGEKAFVAGADIGEMSTLTKEGGTAFGKHGNDVFRAIETLPIPTIAAVNGFALGGGCELSMACDIRICADTAVFGQPETGLGITPGFGGTQRLARLVSPGMAKQLIYTAKNIKADEAYRIGLVNAVYPLEELMPAAEKLAETIAKNAPIAVRACKKAINDGLQVDMDKAIVIEEKLFGSCSSPPTRSRACPPSWRSASTSPTRTSKLIDRRTPDN